MTWALMMKREMKKGDWDRNFDRAAVGSQLLYQMGKVFLVADTS